MANEITVSGSIKAVNGYLTFGPRSVTNLQPTMTGTHSSGGVQDISTTKETIAISSDVATLGWCWLRNTDTTNYIEIGTVTGGTFYPLMKLKPGEFALFRWATGITPYAQANTATAKLEWYTLED